MLKHDRRFPAILAAVLMLGVAAGCQSDGDSDLDGDDRISTRTGDLDRDRDNDGLGNKSDRERAKAGIPEDAQLVARGEGKDLRYRASDDGMIYVQDLDDGERLVYSGRLDRDEEFRIDGQTGRFTVNGRTVEDRNLDSNHKFRVYFDRN